MKLIKTKNVDGTSFQECIRVSYDRLVEVFGQPHYTSEPDSGDKTDAEWWFKVKGKVFTIYNYKNGLAYDCDGLEVSEITKWHVGGHSNDVVELVENLLGL